MAMTLRLTDEQDRALALLAAAQGRSKHDAAVRAIIAQAARTLARQEVAELAERFLDDYAATKKMLRHTQAG
ncbi:CopG family transcriptional regulator [Corynebacterium mendelii]|uniref:CopG family transcriptional regulator n=1 Tax=Corynebacterium mendelii TaxID=2765362 RepID=A0A939IVK3_9CORY|nr:CopG family transcriptional regulator [Corynebacterium mendelii]MBN9644316.1 CopG family transcriptional regulator [Corynebacterium mendelii]